MLTLLAQKWHLVFPLVAGILYAVAAMGYKAARVHGVSAEWLTILANAAIGVAFLGLVDWHAQPFLPDPLWPSFLLGFLFFLGQAFTVLSLSRGDVSVATPVLGAKVVMVAVLLAGLAHEAISWHIWLASILTVAGIVLLGMPEKGVPHHHVWRTVMLSLFSALAFALFDVMTQTWSPRLGFARFVPLGMLLSAVFSLGLLALMTDRRLVLSRPARIYLVAGIGLMTLQGLLLIRAIGLYGDAAAANIVYGTRAIWSVLAVWAVGRWFGNSELVASRRLMVFRLLGSSLVVAGLALVFWPTEH